MVGNGKLLNILNTGNIALPSHHKPIILKNVLHTPTITKQLTSVTRLRINNQAFIELYPNFFLVKDQVSGKVLLHGLLHDGLYKLFTRSSHINSTPQAQALLSSSNKTNLFHNRLGHPFSKIVHAVLNLSNEPSSLSSTFVILAN